MKWQYRAMIHFIWESEPNSALSHMHPPLWGSGSAWKDLWSMIVLITSPLEMNNANYNYCHLCFANYFISFYIHNHEMWDRDHYSETSSQEGLISSISQVPAVEPRSADPQSPAKACSSVSFKLNSVSHCMPIFIQLCAWPKEGQQQI